MTILKTSRDFTNVEKYLMTQDPGIMSVKAVPDFTRMEVSGYLLYEDQNVKGETSELLSVIGSVDGATKVWCCQSATFKRSFSQMFELFEGEPFTIIKTSSVSKAGKDYVDCRLAID
jgi:hypothetical protein